ncbi:MAG: hypothetical protein JWM78_1258 [Verrucomicrobiaceae bacterium]|nr:hypothetical protein [Verrucomicrobiaceae bacterium]
MLLSVLSMSQLAIITCITDQHDLKLVALAGVICLFATYTTFNLLARALDVSPTARTAWLAGAAVALGSGVWTTHFVAMLAYRAHAVVGYDMQRTAISIVVAILGAGVGLVVAANYPRLRILAGVVVGLSIGAMHFIGMAAMTIAGHLQYSAGRVLEALLIGVVLSIFALHVSFSKQTLTTRALAAVLLTLGICGLHFTGMTAAEMVPDNSLLVAAGSAQSGLLAVAIAAISVLILALSLCGSLIDEHLARRGAQESVRLRASELRFRQLASATFEGVFIHIDGRVIDANETLCRMLGQPLEKIVGSSMFDYIDEGSQGRAPE